MAGALGGINTFQFTAATGTEAVIIAAAAGNIAPRASTGILIYALSTNTGIVYIGAAGVTTATGYPIEAGKSVSVPCDDPARIHAIGSGSSQVCGVLYV